MCMPPAAPRVDTNQKSGMKFWLFWLFWVSRRGVQYCLSQAPAASRALGIDSATGHATQLREAWVFCIVRAAAAVPFLSVFAILTALCTRWLRSDAYRRDGGGVGRTTSIEGSSS